MVIKQEHLSPWRVKQPLVIIALLFALGIFLQDHFQFSWEPSLWIALAVSLTWMLISWRVLTPPWPIVPWVITVGAWVTACQWMILEVGPPNHLKNLALRLPQHMVLRGVVQTDPAVRLVDEKGRYGQGAKKQTDSETVAVCSEFELEVSAIKLSATWERACGRVQVRLRGRISETKEGGMKVSEPFEIEFGQEIEVDGVLGPPLSARNFGLFDFAAYLRQRGIHEVFQVNGVDSIQFLGPSSYFRWIFVVRKKLAERLTFGIENDTLATGVIRGMLLGYREDIPSDVNDAFRRTGTLHVFAISGSHITLIALALLIALRPLGISQRWVCCVVLPLLIFYVVATGLRASAIRSLVMAAVVILGWSLRRPSALLNNLAASAFIILAWDPFQLWDAGFQLSFGVVASLILISPFLDRKIRDWLEPDPYLIPMCVPPWRRALLPITRWMAALWAVSLAAWIGSFGLNVYYFNLISFVAILANMLIVPLASVSVVLGLVSLLFGMLWNQLGISLNTAHALLIHAMVEISERLAHWKFGFLYVAQPAAGWIVAGYTVLVAVVFLWWKQRKAQALGVVGFSLMGVGGMILLVWNADQVRFDILDVGSGQAVLITGPCFERVLIDAGNRNQGRVIVEPFLRSRGVNVLDLAILTHGDAAHYGGFLELLSSFPIRRVAVADAHFRSKGYRQLLEKIHQTGVPIEVWSKGDVQFLRSGRIEVLWPPRNLERQRADDLGLVLWLKTRYGSSLFASDAGRSVEKMIEDFPHDSCSMLVQGIHFEEESLTESYLQFMKPKFLVLNTAEYPPKAYPSTEMEERLRESGAHVYRTDQSGGVKVFFERDGIRVRSYLQQ